MISRFQPVVVFASGFFGSMFVAFSACAQIELTRIDGSVSAVDVVAVEGSRISYSGTDANLNDFRVIDFGRKTARNNGRTTIHLSGGGRIEAVKLGLVDDMIQFSYLAGEVNVGVEAATQIRFKNEKLPLFDNAASKEDLDQLFVKIEGNYQTVPGIVERIDDSAIRILYEEDVIEFKLQDVFGVIFAQGATVQAFQRNAVVELTEGSRIVGKLQSMTSDTATVWIDELAKIDIPVLVISSIEVRSDRLVFLSDLEPASTANLEGAILDRRWRKDVNIVGTELSLRDRQNRTVRNYSKGLGTKSGMKLVFNNSNFDRFVSAIGIDAGTNGNGLCKVTVSGDGDVLYQVEVAGADAPRKLDLEISGKKEIELRIDFGSDFLDLSDHLNWCDARFVKNSK
jgi:hypothetical protein